MKKFAAHYLITDDDRFLKNAILHADEDGTPLEYIDTSNDLQEIAQLIFHNGILISNLVFSKNSNTIPKNNHEDSLEAVIRHYCKNKNRLTIQDLIVLAQQMQEHFTEMKIPEIISELSQTLLNKGFSKQNLPGIFLLSGTDLINLHFTSKTQLKKIL